MYSDFHFYIDLNWEDAIGKSVDIYLKELYRLVELAYQHKSKVFYSEKHIQEFVNQMEELDVNFSVSNGNKLSIILEHAIVKNSESYAFELHFAKENTTIHYIDNVLSFVDNHDKIAILTHSNKTEAFLLVRSELDYSIIECRMISSSEKIIQWIATAKPRFFHLSPKHGENGKGNQPNASPLLCSKDEAQRMLNDAIPCFSEKEKNLYYFDIDHNTFIVFFYEGENMQNQWHGFHIVKDRWNEIPNYIQKYFNK